MKKYLFISAVALAALASCSKVTPVEVPDQAITFQVANYASRTKADIREDGFNSFNTYAWYYDEEATAAQQFMNNETVSWDATETQWAPSRPYYWPKTGSVNFYSYAGLTNPTVSEQALVANGVTVDPASSNIIVAKPALNQTKNTNPAQYGDSGATEGVPTLFTHMLAKINFQVALDATGMGTDFTWEVSIDGNQNLMAIPNVGNLSVSYADAGNVPTWTPTTGTADLVSQSVSITEVTNTKSETKPLAAEFIVMPQEIGNLDFTFEYTLTSTYSDGSTVVEVVPVTFKMNKFNAANDEWKYNTVYTYTITIVPNGEVILFDPSVEEWVDGAAGTITVPIEE